jgi:hypothetical protein
MVSIWIAAGSKDSTFDRWLSDNYLRTETRTAKSIRPKEPANSDKFPSVTLPPLSLALLATFGTISESIVSAETI